LQSSDGRYARDLDSDYDIPGERDLDAQPTPQLIRRLADEASTLFTQEMALLKAETRSAMVDARGGLASLATGGAVTFAGFLLLLVAAVLGLTRVMEPWLAALVVGGVVIGVGLIMLRVGRRKLEPSTLRPRYTQASLEKDRHMIKETSR
jgi:hypothetical protein